MVNRRRKTTTAHWTSSAARRLCVMAGNPPTVPDAVRTVVGRYLDGIESPPTDLERLCPRLNIIDMRVEDIPFSGELRQERDGFVVIYSSTSNGPRRRFTIAHEMGHAIVAASGPGWPRTGRELERLCDMLATEILMPRELFLAHCERDVSLARVQELARLFQTSLSATSIRCAELLGLSIFEMDGEEVRWGYGVVRKGPLVKLDHIFLASIKDSLNGEPFEDRVYFRSQQHPAGWWKLECQKLGNDGRALVLMTPALDR